MVAELLVTNHLKAEFQHFEKFNFSEMQNIFSTGIISKK